MKQLKTLFNILSWPIYICIAIYILIAAPRLLGFKPVVVLSGSMEPSYHVGSIIYYKDTPFDEIQVGDAITYQAGANSLVTHRVIEKQEISRMFVTKGDANNTADPNPVSYQEVVGKAMAFSIPYAGYFVTYGKQPAVIAVIAAILIIGMILDNIKPKTSSKAEEP